jgi:hypothetical protein
VGTATIRKTIAILHSILSFALADELVEFNAAAAVRKPRSERAFGEEPVLGGAQRDRCQTRPVMSDAPATTSTVSLTDPERPGNA